VAPPVRKTLVALFVLTFAFAALYADTLTVAVAANVQYAIEDLKEDFEARSGISLVVVLGSSGKLAAQIESGAPFDAFLSADMRYPRLLYADGLAPDSPRIYARGILVLWTLGELDLSKWPSVLLSGQVRKVAVANPGLAPYGEQTVNCLKKYGIFDSLSNKVVYGESISQVNTFLMTGATEAAFTAKSIVCAPGNRDRGRWVEPDRESYEPIEQGMVVLVRGVQKHEKAASELRRYLFSKPARTILNKYGYLTD